MKRKAIGLFFVCMFSVALFAEGNDSEPKSNDKIAFYLSPTLGVSIVPASGIWTAFNVGLDAGLITKSGFTFMANNHLLIGGKLETKDYISLYEFGRDKKIESVGLKGFVWQVSALFGYTYRGVENLHLDFSAGISFMVGNPKFKDVRVAGYKNAISRNEYASFALLSGGFPIRLGLQYYFGDLVGINFAVENTVTIGGHGFRFKSNSFDINKTYLLGDTFTIKIGPVFKF